MDKNIQYETPPRQPHHSLITFERGTKCLKYTPGKREQMPLFSNGISRKRRGTECGDRVIPLRRSKSEWEAIYDDGGRRTFFDNGHGYPTSSKVSGAGNNQSIELLATPDQASKLSIAHQAVLRNELLDENIITIRHTTPRNGSGNGKNLSTATTTTSSTRLLFKPRQLFRYGKNKAMKSKIDLLRPTLQPHNGPPFTDATMQLLTQNKIPRNRISVDPYRVLDAPNLIDDFYSNVMHWSVNNCVAVGLLHELYIYDAMTAQVVKFCALEAEENVTAVRFSPDGTKLAIGTLLGRFLVYNVHSKKLFLQKQEEEKLRIGNVLWNGNDLITFSNKKGVISNYCLKKKKMIRKWSASENNSEICGLAWSHCGTYLASGGNDNLLKIWRLNEPNVLHVYTEHTAAIKAIAWSPFQPGVLVSGGGTACKKLITRNVITGSILHVVHTESQICNVLWSKHSMELVTTHGYNMNSVIVWKYPSFVPVVVLKAHRARVIYATMSPDGESIMTGSADECLRWWKIFKQPELPNSPRSLLQPHNLVR
uniref:WD_REPEATS_REGION domain-containing protein n=1 Tax=Rhabditophanes sp. KR3021 TaxID=114890 RepID=A0AC35TI17_9BILA